MKKMFKILSLSMAICMIAVIFIEMSAKSESFDLGIRYIKLGMTYRESGNYEKAPEFLNKGKNIVERSRSWNGRYWSAAAYENLGYVFREIGMLSESDTYFNKAISIYRDIIKMPGGSHEALEAAIRRTRTIPQNNGGKYSPIPTTGMAILNFDKQRLKEIPANIPDNVLNLSLAENRFADFPAGLFRYRGLEYLNLTNNRIKSVPDNIGDLGNLHYLDLSYNRLKTLPSDIGNLSNLQELNLEGNRLKDVPPSLCSMQNLKLLNLKNNKIPFEKLTNIVKCLPNTNVLFDEYILKEEADEGEDEIVE